MHGCYSCFMLRKRREKKENESPVEETEGDKELTPELPEDITAKVYVRPHTKPLGWLSASMVYGLSQTILSIIATVLVILFVALGVLVGVSTDSIAVGIMVGAPFVLLTWLLVIWVHPRVVRWTLRTLGYEAPGFWQTWAALAWGMLLFLFLGAVMLSPLAWLALGQGHSSSTARISLLVFATLALPILQTFAMGWALAESFGRSRRAAKFVAWVYILAQLLLVSAVVAFTAITLNHIKNTNNGSLIAQSSLSDAAEVAAVYYVNHGQTYSDRTLLARELCTHAGIGRVEGAPRGCTGLVPSAWKATQQAPLSGDHIWLGKVSKDRAEVCTSHGGSRSMYCIILNGDKPTTKGMSDQNLGLALESAKDNLGF